MSEPSEPVDPAEGHDPVGEVPVRGSVSGGSSADWPVRAEPDPQPRGSGFLRGLREVAIVVVTALVISAVVRTFLLQAFWVPSGSMEQTLVRGDRILVWKPGVDPGHGDVIVFKDPANWLADPIPVGGVRGLLSEAAAFVGILPATTGDDLVKRVVGVGGDTIECCSPGGQIIRNGEPLDEPYIHPGDPTDQVTFRVEVPEGRLFVMGDHRSDSADSRYHLEEDEGTVPVENVVGTAEVIMWPISRWATLPTYAEEQGALPAGAADPVGP
ncbi:MAG: signal peptidase I [Candidatus Nanopelagicales bacterium]|nr:signal peptidase I [Candidatus Nanopelagicales bacterium]